jgi:tRNA(fMet)-specific endonuclease VapC
MKHCLAAWLTTKRSRFPNGILGALRRGLINVTGRVRFFVDTNIWIFCLRGRSPEAWARLNRESAQQVVLALQTFAELWVGIEKCARPEAEQAKMQAMIAPYAVILPTLSTARYYARIRADLEKRGQSISEQDLWVAATALEEGGAVVTNNVDEFTRIPGLVVEDWTLPQTGATGAP